MLSASHLSWLRSFEAAARRRSFTLAAQDLCVTQGAVSQQVKLLEEHLQRPLFVRGPRQLTLTPEGEQLAAVAHEAMSQLDAALAALRQDRQAPRTLVLSCPPSLALGWLARRLGDGRPAGLVMPVSLRAEFHRIDRARLQADGVDAAIRYDLGGHPGLHSHRFMDEWLLPVASPAFVAANPSLREGGPLRGDWLLHDLQPWDGAPPHAEWQHWLQHSGRACQGLAAGRGFNLLQLALSAALDGQGIAMGRATLVQDELRSGRLVQPFGPAVPAAAGYHLLAERDDAALQALREWLQQQGQAAAEAVRPWTEAR